MLYPSVNVLLLCIFNVTNSSLSCCSLPDPDRLDLAKETKVSSFFSFMSEESDSQDLNNYTNTVVSWVWTSTCLNSDLIYFSAAGGAWNYLKIKLANAFQSSPSWGLSVALTASLLTPSRLLWWTSQENTLSLSLSVTGSISSPQALQSFHYFLKPLSGAML